MGSDVRTRALDWLSFRGKAGVLVRGIREVQRGQRGQERGGGGCLVSGLAFISKVHRALEKQLNIFPFIQVTLMVKIQEIPESKSVQTKVFL